jgi:tetratricopeptide (TPR) repeat protein
LARLAVERTPPESTLLDERVVRLADLLFEAGDRPASTRLLESVLERNPEPVTRVEVLLRLATVWSGTRPSREVRRLCLEALQLAEGDRVLQARARLLLADTAESARDRLNHARGAVAILGRDGPSALRAEAMNAVAVYTTQAGRRVDMQLIESAVELKPAATDRTSVEEARFTRGWLLLMDDELDRARADFNTVLRYWEERGNEPILATIFAQLAHLELRAGNWPASRQWGLSMLEAAERSSERFWTGLAHAQLASLAAVRGDEATAVEGLGAAERIADEIDDAFLRMVVALNRAMRALAQERFEEADQLMAVAREQRTGRLTTPACCPGPAARWRPRPAPAIWTGRSCLPTTSSAERGACAVVERSRWSSEGARSSLPPGATWTVRSCRPAHRFEPSVACPHPSRRRAACLCSGRSSVGGERSGRPATR